MLFGERNRKERRGRVHEAALRSHQAVQWKHVFRCNSVESIPFWLQRCELQGDPNPRKKKHSQLLWRRWNELNFWRNTARRHVALANHLLIRFTASEFTFSDASLVITWFCLVLQFKTRSNDLPHILAVYCCFKSVDALCFSKLISRGSQHVTHTDQGVTRCLFRSECTLKVDN